MRSVENIELLVNIRQNIRDILKLWSSKEMQLEYQKNVPIAQVSAELFCQWDDFYNPEDSHFQSSFTSMEIEQLRKFDATLETVSNAIPDELSPIESFIKSNSWKSVNRAAVGTLSHIKFGIKRADFVVQVNYIKTEEGGRHSYATSGYRPHFELPGKKELTSAEQIFLNKDKVLPGESALAEIRIIWIEPFKGALSEGQSFSLNEGDRKVAQGIILAVLNPELKKNS